jgi:hypothetical protein
MVLVRDQRHLSHVGKHARHLPHHADLVDDRLAGLISGIRAAIHEELLRERSRPVYRTSTARAAPA